MITTGDTPFFNPETMAGVFPGSRTQLYQRFQVLSTHLDNSAPTWLQLLWHDEPPACVAYAYTPGKIDQIGTALLQIPNPLAGGFQQRLQAALNAAGLQMKSCGNCAFWRLSTLQNPDHLPVGHCQWKPCSVEGLPGTPTWLEAQSVLAAACIHWQLAPPLQGRHPEQPPAIETPDTRAALAATSIAPIRRAAETADVRLRWSQRLFKWFSRRIRIQRPKTNRLAELVERSGVGAGVAPCFVCQGRIANLGALAVATPEGDKQTFSIWRCRNCYTFYLNDWVDRWERLDSLETEETYYRIAPAEAVELLQVIIGVEGGDHPGRRQERAEERAKFLKFLAGHPPLAHQVRQGR